MQIVDTSGLLCPAPLIKTKKALVNSPQGEEFLVRCDNETAFENLQNYLRELGFKLTVEQKEGRYELRFVKGENMELGRVDVQAYCAPSNLKRMEAVDGIREETGIAVLNKRGYILVVNSLSMGRGDADLGSLLMKAYINTLGEVEHLPTTILFYNEGVRWACRSSEVLLALRSLEMEGVEILSCGTCLDFFDIKGELAVGKVSNMYKIAEILSQGKYVVYP